MGPLIRVLLRQRASSALFVIEVALALAVGVHAFLLAARYGHAGRESTGLPDEHVLYATVDLESGDFDAPGWRDAVVARDVAALRALPWVAAVADANEVPLFNPHLETIGESGAAGAIMAWFVDDRGGVADALGLQLVEGRALAASDLDARDAVPAVITETLAARLFGRRSAIGHELTHSTSQRPLTVVGVVRAFRAVTAWSPDADCVALVSERAWHARSLAYVVRTGPRAPSDAADAIVAALARHDPETIGERLPPGTPESPQPAREARPRAARAVSSRALAQIDLLVAQESRASRGLALVMATLMLLLIFLGRVGLSTFLVAERRKEISVRRALGATRGDILRWILAENALLTSAGLVLGLPLAFGLNRAALAIAPEMRLPFDPRVLASMCAGLLAVGLGSAILPAKRAATVPPGEAARS